MELLKKKKDSKIALRAKVSKEWYAASIPNYCLLQMQKINKKRLNAVDDRFLLKVDVLNMAGASTAEHLLFKLSSELS